MLQVLTRYFLLGSLFLISACIPIHEVQPDNVSVIHTGPGPEDLVHDKFEGRNRLLISCTDRSDDGTYGEIESYQIDSEDTTSTLLPRVGFSTGFSFHPHGIDIIEREGTTYLYVVNHYKDDEDNSSIVIMRVEENQLVFVKEFRDGLIATPNAVTAHPNGGFYITNDGTSTLEGVIEFLFNDFNGSVAYCSYNDECNKVAGNLSYPNGIIWDDGEIYVSTILQKAVFEYDVLAADDLSERSKLSGGLGLDNIRLHEDYLIIAQHTELGAFLAHYGNPDLQSPCKVLAVHKTTGDVTVLFQSSGDLLSGASTGLIADDDLYIGQVVNPYLLKVADIGL